MVGHSPVALRVHLFRFWACCRETRESFPDLNLAALRFVRDASTCCRVVARSLALHRRLRLLNWSWQEAPVQLLGNRMGANHAAVPNFPEPVSSTHDDVSAPKNPSLPQPEIRIPTWCLWRDFNGHFRSVARPACRWG